MSTSGEETDLGILPKLGHQIALIYDLLSGPPMTEQQRINRALTESDTIRKWERFSI